MFNWKQNNEIILYYELLSQTLLFQTLLLKHT